MFQRANANAFGNADWLILALAAVVVVILKYYHELSIQSRTAAGVVDVDPR